MKKLLFVDTETTGLPVTYDAPFTDVHNWPRILQIAWELCYEDGTPIKNVCELVKPDGWKVPTGDFWKEHGFTTAKNEKHGKPAKDLLYDLAVAMCQADMMVCHNLSYDKPIIECECFRYKVFPKAVARDLRDLIDLRPENVTLEKHCTKLLSAPILKIPGYRGDYKWPSLEEAYQFMFGKKVEGAHDAGWDVKACKEIFLWIRDYEQLL